MYPAKLKVNLNDVVQVELNLAPGVTAQVNQTEGISKGILEGGFSCPHLSGENPSCLMHEIQEKPKYFYRVTYFKDGVIIARVEAQIIDDQTIKDHETIPIIVEYANNIRAKAVAGWYCYWIIF